MKTASVRLSGDPPSLQDEYHGDRLSKQRHYIGCNSITAPNVARLYSVLVLEFLTLTGNTSFINTFNSPPGIIVLIKIKDAFDREELEQNLGIRSNILPDETWIETDPIRSVAIAPIQVECKS